MYITAQTKTARASRISNQPDIPQETSPEGQQTPPPHKPPDAATRVHVVGGAVVGVPGRQLQLLSHLQPPEDTGRLQLPQGLVLGGTVGVVGVPVPVMTMSALRTHNEATGRRQITFQALGSDTTHVCSSCSSCSSASVKACEQLKRVDSRFRMRVGLTSCVTPQGGTSYHSRWQHCQSSMCPFQGNPREPLRSARHKRQHRSFRFVGQRREALLASVLACPANTL